MKELTFADMGIEIPPGRAGEVDTLCPHCSHERKKSRARCLSVNTELGTWFCHHCGWSGALGTQGSGRAWRPRSLPAPAPPRVFAKPQPLPDTPLPSMVVGWFAQRGIPEWVLIEASIRSSGGAILFPYLRDAQLVNVKHRLLIDKRFWMEAGAERILYNLDAAVRAPTLVFVEGEVDALSIRAAGGPPALSVPDGAPPPDARHYASKFSFLGPDTLLRLRAATTVLIGTDMDAPGRRLANELAQRLGHGRCRRVSWTPYKDANEMLVAEGPQGVRHALAAAEPFSAPNGLDAAPHRRSVLLLPPSRGRRPIVTLAASGNAYAHE